MHVLFLTDNFPPEFNAPAIRTHAHCRVWVKKGHCVTVITGAPNHPRGKVYEGYKNRLWQTEIVDGIRVIRVWTYMAPNAGRWKRILDYLSFMIAAVVASIFVRGIDVVIGTSPHLFTVLAAHIVAALKRRPWVFELRDLWPASIRDIGVMRRGLGAADWVVRGLYRNASKIVVVTDAFRHELIKSGIPDEKIAVVTNGVDRRVLRPSHKNEKLEQTLGIAGKFVVGYIGTIGMSHGISTVVQAAKRLKDDPNITFVLIGDGAERASVLEQAGARPNLVMVPPVLHCDIQKYWSVLDCCIVPLRDKPVFKTVIPSKLFEAMAMGVPVLLGVQGQALRLVEQYDFGRPFAPEDDADLANKIVDLSQDSRLQSMLSENAKRAAGDFDRDDLAVKMLAVLHAVASRTEYIPPTSL